MIWKIETENRVKSATITEIKSGDISEYKVCVEFSEKCSPKPLSIIWEEAQIDMYGFWSSKSHQSHNLTPEWYPRTNDSKTASGMPLACIYNKGGDNRLCIALSDPASPAKISTGVVEENGCLRFQIDLFSQLCAEMESYQVILRIDRRKIPFYKAIISTRDWWSELGYKSAYVPAEARLPMYSCWYSFHQKTIPDEILYECKIAKALGMDTVIVDDGWQTDDNNRGYAFCGDWRVCESKIPDMKGFAHDIHALGMKLMIWFSVPFVGFNSENFERFRGMYLHTRERMKACVLDPRFPKVREFLVSTYREHVSKYGYDGLKLDFIDSFQLTEESSCDYEKMDCLSVEEGLQRLLSEATTELKKINPQILNEFRQSYIGPIVGQFGNLFRVTDRPNDALFNRIGSLDLRLTSDKIPVHSDMLMWNKDDTNESVAYQLLATMFCVPQISVRFDNITSEHRSILGAYLKFWREHQKTILDGEITVWGVDSNYTAAKTKNGGQSVAVLYENVPYVIENDEIVHLFNSTGNASIYVESEREREYAIYDIFGVKYASGTLLKGVNKIALGNCERMEITE